MIFGSALCALEGKQPEIGENAVKELISVLDNEFVIPERDLNKEPMFAAEHVYQIKGTRLFIFYFLKRLSRFIH